MTNTIKLRKILDEDVEKLLAWRNSNKVSKAMINQDPITWAEHQAWYQLKKNDPNTELLIGEYDDNAFGFVRFDINYQKRRAEWGIYTSPDARAGLGISLGAMALDLAFYILRLNFIRAKIISTNNRSLNFHKKLGFSCIEDNSRNHLISQKEIIEMKITIDEWRDIKKKGSYDNQRS